MFIVARLGIHVRLATMLTTSNSVESMISIARATNRNVTPWRDGQVGIALDRRGHAQRRTILPPHQGGRVAGGSHTLRLPQIRT